jgi:hypothetical protein
MHSSGVLGGHISIFYFISPSVLGGLADSLHLCNSHNHLGFMISRYCSFGQLLLLARGYLETEGKGKERENMDQLYTNSAIK